VSEADRRAAITAACGHGFQDWALIERALTHASFGDGHKTSSHNERLEFLGDRVLGLIAAEHLHGAFRDAKEGGLANRLNAMVNKAACARAARRAGLGALLRMSKAEETVGGRDKEGILADACEAVFAALYLDAGLPAARAFFQDRWAEELSGLSVAPRDPKTLLQEWAHGAGKAEPRYAIVAREGPAHAPRFTVEVRVSDLSAQGAAGAKQEAERDAARALLNALGLAHV
jgi:ribonuclease III